jgi:hypothetical protein
VRLAALLSFLPPAGPAGCVESHKTTGNAGSASGSDTSSRAPHFYHLRAAPECPLLLWPICETSRTCQKGSAHCLMRTRFGRIEILLILIQAVFCSLTLFLRSSTVSSSVVMLWRFFRSCRRASWHRGKRGARKTGAKFSAPLVNRILTLGRSKIETPIASSREWTRELKSAWRVARAGKWPRPGINLLHSLRGPVLGQRSWLAPIWPRAEFRQRVARERKVRMNYVELV